MWIWKAAWVDARAAEAREDGSNRYAEVGSLGDSFAPLAGAFTALALLAALVSVALQSKELALTRDEMTLQRKASEESAETLKKQADAQTEANRLSRLATRLACVKEVAEVDQEGIRQMGSLRARTKEAELPEVMRKYSNRTAWLHLCSEFAPGKLPGAPFNTPGIYDLLETRHEIGEILFGLDPRWRERPPEPPVDDPPEEEPV
jgi:hypothetical protein